jgi:hypothetical protein
LPSIQLELNHSYDPSGPISNDVFNVVRDGEPMFSPYTSWKLQISAPSLSDDNFKKDVEKCRSKLLLTFYGTSVYFDKRSFSGQASVRIPVHECYSVFEAIVLSIVPKE